MFLNRICNMLVSLLALSLSCNDRTVKRANEVGLDDSIIVEEDWVEVEEVPPLEPFWVYEYDEDVQDFRLRQLRENHKGSTSSMDIEAMINNNWPNVQVEVYDRKKDTVFVAISSSAYLTQQMGTAGADAFMISTTFNFTELHQVNYVFFDFEEGDHAVPGLYSRSSWKFD